MKKFAIGIISIIILFFIIIFYLLTHEKEWKVSELSAEGEYLPQLKGALKNVSNTDCEKVQINFVATSGDLEAEGWVWIENPDVGEINYFDDIIYSDAGDIENLEDYKIKLVNVECWIEKDANE